MLRLAFLRLLHGIPVLLGVSLLAFLLIHIVPGDPVEIMLGNPEMGGAGSVPAEDIERLREELGLNDPLVVQFGRFLAGAARGDLGNSIRSNRPVSEELLTRLPKTVLLASVAMVFAVVIGVTAGVIAASNHRRPTDTVATVVAVTGLSIPNFWLGLLLITFFSVRLRWFPVAGSDSWRHVILPAITLGVAAAAALARMTRSGMLEVLSQDYVTTARSKGLTERAVLYRHALRNALIPVVTVLGLQVGALLGGAVIVEVVFAWPGLGQLAVNSVLARDFPVVQGIVLYTAVVYVLINIGVDLLYAYIDPRIRLG